MPNATPSLDTIFCEAIEIGAAAERAVYLAQACGGDEIYRQRIEALVAAHFRAGSFLDRPADTPDVTAAFAPTTAEPGTAIGPYKLLERIAEGGMGAVYVAEQTEPVRRRVALKLIKPGMDTREVVARFEAERQALALMDHPHIAKVLDAGATAAGRPYFVMELVRGLPVTEYCDQARLPPDRRLRLFAQVCRAVQHAHQKGVIHRDIKPSNVLVTLHDGEPVPKVIDFGVAKAVNQRLTDKTLYTQLAQMIGTPLYMSPEQAELSGLDIDTRSDVYSLGVLLYELLTGSTPFDADTLRRAGFDEMRRMIREDEPALPSARFSTLAAAARSTASARRGLDDRQLGRLLNGDLDWLVMKALEKDRNRRYESAGAFAADVERYLADEPVQARPPSAAYRLRKFAQRNKAALTTAAILAVAVFAVASSLGWSLRDTAVRRWAAEGAATAALAESVDHHRAGRPEAALASATRAVDTLAGVPGTDGLAAVAWERVAELKMAARLEDLWLEGISSGRFGGDEAIAGAAHAAFRDFGIDPTVLPVAEAAERIRQRLIVAELVNGLDDWQDNLRGTDRAADPLALKLRAVAAAADPDPWRRRVRELALDSTPDQVASLAAEFPVDVAPPETSARLGNRLRRAAEAVALLRRAARSHPGHVHINFTMADVLMRSPAEPARLEALGFYRAALSSRPRSPVIMDRVGVCLTDHLGRPAEGAEVFREVIRLHPDYFPARHNLSVALRRQGKHAEAVAAAREAVAVAPVAWAYHALGHELRELGRKEEAAEAFRAAVRCEPQTAEDHLARGRALNALRRGDEAIPAYKEAIRLRPDFADAYRELGFELKQRGAVAEALSAYRQALKYAPDMAVTHNGIGTFFSDQERLEEAIAAYKEAIWIKPDYSEAHYNLGKVLAKLNRWEEAVAAYEQAIKLRPTFAEAHCNVGHVFRGQGQYAKSLVAYRRGHELGAKNPAWPYPSAQWVETAQRLTSLAPRLPAILSGADDPADPADAVAAAEVAAHRAKLVRAAELFRSAFTKSAVLSDNPKTRHRYNAACCAARASCGQGEGAVGLDGMARAGWRRQALEWLRAELGAWKGQLADGTTASRRVVEAGLVRWQRDADLACVRDTTALAGLPQAEDTEWKQFWADVRSTLVKAQAPAEKIN